MNISNCFEALQCLDASQACGSFGMQEHAGKRLAKTCASVLGGMVGHRWTSGGRAYCVDRGHSISNK